MATAHDDEIVLKFPANPAASPPAKGPGKAPKPRKGGSGGTSHNGGARTRASRTRVNNTSAADLATAALQGRSKIAPSAEEKAVGRAASRRAQVDYLITKAREAEPGSDAAVDAFKTAFDIAKGGLHSEIKKRLDDHPEDAVWLLPPVIETLLSQAERAPFARPADRGEGVAS